MRIHRKEGGLTFARIDRNTPVLRPVLQSKQNFMCHLHRSTDRGGGGLNSRIVSVKIAADIRGQRSRKIINEEREKYRAKNIFLRNTSTNSKGAAFVILKNRSSAPIRKETWSPTSKARRKPAEMSLWKREGCQTGVKSFREINSRENCPRAWPGFVKPIQNGLSREQNLI